MEPIQSELTKRYFFDPSDPLFDDHFPGCPIIPGSLALACFQDAVRNSAELCNGAALELKGVRLARFIRFGRPGWMEVMIRRRDEHNGCVAFQCRAEQEGHVLSDATLEYRIADGYDLTA